MSLQTSPRQIPAPGRVQTWGSTERGDKIQIHLNALVVLPYSSGSQQSQMQRMAAVDCLVAQSSQGRIE